MTTEGSEGTNVSNSEEIINRLCALVRALSNTLKARDPSSPLPGVARDYLESIGQGVPLPPRFSVYMGGDSVSHDEGKPE